MAFPANLGLRVRGYDPNPESSLKLDRGNRIPSGLPRCLLVLSCPSFHRGPSHRLSCVLNLSYTLLYISFALSLVKLPLIIGLAGGGFFIFQRGIVIRFQYRCP